METNNNLAVTLTVAQMQSLISECVKEALKTIEQTKEEQVKYLTRLEACKALHISLPTLSHYSELGLIPAKRIGNRILYLEADIQNALKDIPTRKYNK